MLRTVHEIFYNNAGNLKNISDDSIDFILTSPPYPMIEMWDSCFTEKDETILKAITSGDGQKAFQLMHRQLDSVWRECYRVLKPGSFTCINIGDATRTVDKNFKLYSNHARILSYCEALGFEGLPVILWRKQTNAPNKFMGSGMFPAGAYVTLEHEYILVLRKGGKRYFNSENMKMKRRESAFFWEERNTWFSDIWDLKGNRQDLSNSNTRNRSAAFPFELAYRLINMYSVKEDTILDPFLGTGTTTLASIAAARNSIGYEIDRKLKETILATIKAGSKKINKVISDRLTKHKIFVDDYTIKKGKPHYLNKHYGFHVVTRQEENMLLNYVNEIRFDENDKITVSYTGLPGLDNVVPPSLIKFDNMISDNNQLLLL
ncbi:MAG: site-specific DNA-methyltransferase [Spirochaetota bacterium]